MSAVPSVTGFEARDSSQSLREVALELRQLVTSLRTRRHRDHAWLLAARQRLQELGERLAAARVVAAGHGRAARVAAAGRGRAAQAALVALAHRLREQAAALGEVRSAQRLRTLRDSLAGTWEDLVAHLRTAGVWSEADQPRGIRVPRPARTAVHVLLGLSGVLLYQLLLTRGQALLVLGTIGALFGSLEIARRIWPKFNDWMVDRLFHGIVRPRERYRTVSATWYLLGLAVATAIAPREAVCVAALVLAFGDPAAAIIGHRWGRRKLRRDKSVVGTLAFVVAGALAAGVYLALAAPHVGLVRGLALVVTVAAVGAAVELFGDRLDDNFGIPVAGALVGLLFV
jgi:dolichol kinase